MIRQHILEKDAPQTVSSAPRPGLKVKRQVEVKLKRSQINRLVDILKEAGEEELISVLTPHQTLAQVQKLMLEMVREKGKSMCVLSKKKRQSFNRSSYMRWILKKKWSYTLGHRTRSSRCVGALMFLL